MPFKKLLKFPRRFDPRDNDAFKVKEVETKADKDIRAIRKKTGLKRFSAVKYVCLAILQYDPEKKND